MRSTDAHERIKNSPLRSLRPFVRRALPETRHINDESVFHIAFQHSLIGSIDVIDGDHLNVRNDVMFGAKIQHVLSFTDPADERTRYLAALEDQIEDVG